jgi:hypothetical protein
MAPQSLQPVGILQDARLGGLGRDPGRKAVRGNGMGHGRDLIRRIARQCGKKTRRRLGRQGRGTAAAGMVLRQVHRIMQNGGRNQHRIIRAALLGSDRPCVAQYAADMAKIMRAIGMALPQAGKLGLAGGLQRSRCHSAPGITAHRGRRR